MKENNLCCQINPIECEMCSVEDLCIDHTRIIGDGKFQIYVCLRCAKDALEEDLESSMSTPAWTRIAIRQHKITRGLI
jgi:protein-arginine kinase activator protein McsA